MSGKKMFWEVDVCITLYWIFFPDLQMIVFDKLFQILLNEKISRVSLFNSPWILCKLMRSEIGE